MTVDRVEVIRSVLVADQPVRPLLAYEQSGPLVQLLASHTTLATWQAPPTLLAKAIAKALTRAEEKDIPPAGTPSTAHALVLEISGPDYIGACRCGRPIGRTPQSRSLDGLVGVWEQHARETDADTAWAAAVASLPSSSSIGAS